jgi:hypothetical protein
MAPQGETPDARAVDPMEDSSAGADAWVMFLIVFGLTCLTLAVVGLVLVFLMQLFGS